MSYSTHKISLLNMALLDFLFLLLVFSTFQHQQVACVDEVIGATSVYYEYPEKEGAERGVEFKGYLAKPTNIAANTKVPGVLIIHDWNGLDSYEKRRADMLAQQMGVVALAADIFGNGTVGKNSQENRALIGPFRANATQYIHRINAALHHLKGLFEVDPSKITAMGYCFGGSGVINMARFGLDILGVVSFHGGLKPVAASQLPDPLPEVKAKLIITTGYNDPSIPPDQVAAFEREMTDRSADWEMVVYSDTYHSFTVPGSNHTNRAVYSARADSRSWARTKQFFKNLFEETEEEEALNMIGM